MPKSNQAPTVSLSCLQMACPLSDSPLKLFVCREYHERDDRHLAGSRLQITVQSRQRLDEHVGPLVGELVATRGEQVERLLEIEVEVTMEVTEDELVDAVLGSRVAVLMLLEEVEPDVESVGKDEVCLAAEDVFHLEVVRHCCQAVGNNTQVNRVYFLTTLYIVCAY